MSKPKKGEGERFEQLFIDGARCMHEFYGMPIAVVEFTTTQWQSTILVRQEWIERDDRGRIQFNHALRRQGSRYVARTVKIPSEDAKVVAIVRDPQDRVKCYGLDWRRLELELFPIQRDAAHRFERQRRHGPLYYDRGVLIDSEIHPHVLEDQSDGK
jgi:hypothetical protein